MPSMVSMAAAVALDGQHHAGEHRPAVEDDAAGAAGALGAELLGAGEPQLVLEHVLQGPLRLHWELMGLTVHQKSDGDR